MHKLICRFFPSTLVRNIFCLAAPSSCSFLQTAVSMSDKLTLYTIRHPLDLETIRNAHDEKYLSCRGFFLGIVKLSWR